MTRLTVDFLRRLKPCAGQLALFESLYPDGVEVTAEAVLEAQTAGLLVDWLIINKAFAPLRAEYDRQEALLRAEYKRAEYKRAEYKRAEYNRQKVLLMVDLINKMIEAKG